MGNYTSEPHREHTFAFEESKQLLDDGRFSEQAYELKLLLPFFPRVMLCDARVAMVLFVELGDHRLVDRPLQERRVLLCYKSATAM